MNKPLAYDAYQELAERYAALIDTKPHNAYYERPAMLAMWPELSGKHVLDAGCGPGVYAEEFEASPVPKSFPLTQVIECLSARASDLGTRPICESPIFHNRLRCFQTRSSTLSTPRSAWTTSKIGAVCFGSLQGFSNPADSFQFSCAHPAHDAAYFSTEDYSATEQVQATWRGFGISVVMPCYRRSLEEVLMPLLETGFQIQKLIEPKPTEGFRAADLRRYNILLKQPSFLCVQSSLAVASNSGST